MLQLSEISGYEKVPRNTTYVVSIYLKHFVVKKIVNFFQEYIIQILQKHFHNIYIRMFVMFKKNNFF